MASREERKASPKCGKTTKRRGLPCNNAQGYKTDNDTGPCYLHGGKSPGPPLGNKNAIVTGEYEVLYLSALPDEQRRLFLNIDLSPLEQTENNLRMICLRIHRALIRLRGIDETAQDEDNHGLSVSSVTTHYGWNVKGKVDFQVTERVSTLDTELRIEEALTRLQTLKIKAVDALRDVLSATDTGEDRLASLVKAIDRSALTIAAIEESTQ